MKKPAPIMFGLVLAVTVAACAAPVPLGDGSLAGVLPSGWHDSTRTSPEMILRITDDYVPLAGGRALEALVDIRFDRGTAETFLASLRPVDS